jgi:hypothetical protein
MTDTPHGIDDHRVVYKGQIYRRIAIKPFMRVDGTVTQLATWETCCAECGEPFTIETTARVRKLRGPNRRCAEHRRPGSPVRLARGLDDV